ncbi:MAG: hypothetical protein ACOYJI_06360 [Anaerovoracaceae bacterium]
MADGTQSSVKKKRSIPGRISDFFRAYGREVKSDKRSFTVYTILRALIIVCIVRQFMLGNYESVFTAALTLIFLTIPTILELSFKVNIPQALEIIILIFIYAAEILGEVNQYYTRIPFWDTILHTLNGFLAAAVGFSMVLLLNKNQNIIFEISPLYISIVSFCFSMTIGVCWEFIEFSFDHLFAMDMQKDTIIHSISSGLLNPDGQKPVTLSHIGEVAVNGQTLDVGGYIDVGLIDTMEDLFVNFIGALTFSIIGYYSLKGNSRFRRLIDSLTLRRKTEADDYLAQEADNGAVEEALREMDKRSREERREKEREKRDAVRASEIDKLQARLDERSKEFDRWEQRLNERAEELTAWQERLEKSAEEERTAKKGVEDEDDKE